MCGILGVVGEPLGELPLASAMAALRQRGPDEAGCFRDPATQVILAHTRLAVVDLETGRQPLSAADGEIVLVCNGELYGDQALRADLESRGHRFRSRSDAEVIIGLYREYGMDFFAHLRGEFAFLLYDRPRGHLLAVRDRFGIKPLFHARSANGWVFASEAKAIFATGLVRPELHLPAIRELRAEAWADSAFAGIGAVEPGGYLRLDVRDGSVAAGTYWSLDLGCLDGGGAELSFAEYRDGVAQRLDEAVRLRLRADVPLGLTLSGGLDSSAVAGIARRHVRGELHAFSITFPDHPALDEAEVARRSAAWLGLTHHELVAGESTLLDALEESLWHSELPTASLNGAGKHLLAELAARHVKVVLGGEGSDEVFLGYDYFHPLSRRARWLRCLLLAAPEEAPLALRPLLRGIRWLQRQPYCRRHHAVLSATPRGGSSVHHRERRRRAPQHVPLLRTQYFALRGRMLSHILTVVGDRPEMAHGLEGRLPFLDHHLFEFARRIPLGWKIHQGVEKHVLREAVADRVTEEVRQRRKFGYRAPQPVMRRGRNAVLDSLLDRYLSRRATRAAGIYRPIWIGLLRWLRARLADHSGLGQGIDRFLFYAMSVHILHSQYVAPTAVWAKGAVPWPAVGRLSGGPGDRGQAVPTGRPATC